MTTTPPKYPKIESLYKRNEKGKMLFDGEFSRDEFHFLQDNTWTFWEKIDGTNVRVHVPSHNDHPANPDLAPTFYGRTDKATLHPELLSALAGMLDPLKLAEVFPDGAVLYGEGIGPKIQAKVGVRYRSDSHDFILFDVRCGHYWLTQAAVTDIAEKLNLNRAPQIAVGNLIGLRDWVEDGFHSRVAQDETLIAEGIVARPRVEMLTRAGWPIITKLKGRDFPILA